VVAIRKTMTSKVKEETKAQVFHVDFTEPEAIAPET